MGSDRAGHLLKGRIMMTRSARSYSLPVPALLLLLGLPAAAVADCVFVNTNSVPNSVAAFWVESDGSLRPVAGSPFAT
ncbi:MAG TPA: hypothetical protein VEG34_16035, partial [Thermoanaerobaculia bacterium]|nr:hypothetical protein [Thermoanaerobaculia bacterium]